MNNEAPCTPEGMDELLEAEFGKIQAAEPEVTEADIHKWYKMTQDLDILKNAEIALRNRIFKSKFPTPVEGTNRSGLGQGYDLKAVHVVNRSVDEPALGILMPQFHEAKIPVDALIRFKPELVKSEYSNLTAEQKKLFDQALTIKNGTPQLDVVKATTRKRRK